MDSGMYPTFAILAVIMLITGAANRICRHFSWKIAQLLLGVPVGLVVYICATGVSTFNMGPHGFSSQTTAMIVYLIFLVAVPLLIGHFAIHAAIRRSAPTSN